MKAGAAPSNHPGAEPLLDVDWDGLCRRHVGVMLASARRCCSRYGLPGSEAEDLVQEAVLHSMPRPIRGHTEENALRYVLSAIRNRACDRARHSRHNRRVHLGPDQPDLQLDRLHLATRSVSRPLDLDTMREVRALSLARDRLALHVDRSRDVARAQVDALFALRAVGRSAAEHAAAVGATPAQVKKWAERGAYLVEGWLHARCHTRPLQSDWPPLRQRYWARGHAAALACRFVSDSEDPDAP
ncbi:MAG: sigma-70 family RNA polymerase sigma factor [Deltaproteobacteria bacterium]|nr:MAG: sigma-70 family RNA polymerase sigma factor [Deltaproteobacteria bacterium]